MPESSNVLQRCRRCGVYRDGDSYVTRQCATHHDWAASLTLFADAPDWQALAEQRGKALREIAHVLRDEGLHTEATEGRTERDTVELRNLRADLDRLAAFAEHAAQDGAPGEERR